MTLAWRPLFDGEVAAEMHAIVEDIAAATADGTFDAPGNVDPRVAPAWQHSLDGLAGQSLLHAYLALDSGAESHADTAISLLDRATDAVGALTLPASLYFGFIGISWVAAHLSGRIFEESDDNLREVDETLIAALGGPVWQGTYDLFEGLVGIGVYALERVPRPSAVRLIELVVSRLAARAVHHEDGTGFFTAPEELPAGYRRMFPDGTYNLGMAHGVAGVISLLGAICDAGVATDIARPLLSETVAWLLARERLTETGYRFSNTYPPMAIEVHRLAWCHGDLAVATALLIAARSSGDPSWASHARRIAAAAAVRTVGNTTVPDAGICHGAAGIGHVFNRLYHETGDEQLGDAARLWLRHAVALREPGLGIGGYRMFQQGERYAHPGFRIGSAGIGLAMLAATSCVHPEWDRLLLASSRRSA